jgi:hypothetical protein
MNASQTSAAPSRASTNRRALAALLALALVSVLVIRTSNAAFTAQTENTGNAFATATIGLDTDLTQPLFGGAGAVVEATALVPGSVVSGCITIDFSDTSGQLTDADLTAVELQIDGASGLLANALAVDVEVEEDGCGGAVLGTLSGSLAGFGSQPTAWTPSGDGDEAGYRFTVTLPTGAGNTLMGTSVEDVTLRWSVATS